jgi:hypothetical protein
VLEAKFARGGQRQIDQPIVDERATIVDPQRQAPAILQIDHLDHARQLQGRVRRGERVHIVDLAVRGLPPVIGLAVPRRDPGGLVLGDEPRIVPSAVDLVRLADLEMRTGRRGLHRPRSRAAARGQREDEGAGEPTAATGLSDAYALRLHGRSRSFPPGTDKRNTADRW